MPADEQDPDEAVRKLTETAKKIYDRAQETQAKWSAENHIEAVSELIKSIRWFSKALIGIGHLDINRGELKTTLMNQNFKISPDIATDANSGFYRITLCAFLRREQNSKFTYAEVAVNLVGGGDGKSEPRIYSVAPMNTDEKVAIKKTFGLTPKIELAHTITAGTVTADPGISYNQTREYTEIHPLIQALFDAKQDVTWQYMTGVGVKEITGTQTMELIIKQPLGISSEWVATLHEVKVSWRKRTIRLKSFFTRKKLPRVEPRVEHFNVPKD
jgi:hypothetical protein